MLLIQRLYVKVFHTLTANLHAGRREDCSNAVVSELDIDPVPHVHRENQNIVALQVTEDNVLVVQVCERHGNLSSHAVE